MFSIEAGGKKVEALFGRNYPVALGLMADVRTFQCGMQDNGHGDQSFECSPEGFPPVEPALRGAFLLYSQGEPIHLSIDFKE